MTQVASMLSADDRRMIADALEKHAEACIARGIRAKNEGASIDPYKTAAALAARAADVYRNHKPGSETARPLVTKREAEVAGLLADGLDTAAIAARLLCSDRTVKNTISGLANRFALANRAHVVAWALRKGVI